MRLYYTLTTLDPVVISPNNGSLSNHLCLDYIPGNTILGALAARHYGALSPAQSWLAFHNGQCRFSPCYPVIDDQGKVQIGLPIPASWHVHKDTTAITNQRLDYDKILNQGHHDFTLDLAQSYSQCPLGYMAANGQVALVRKGITGKTAVDDSTGRAKESHLFAYAYIEAGQTFAGWIDCTDERVMAAITPTLNQTLRLGRSRNTEFGRVKLTVVKGDMPSASTKNALTLTLWCLSDCEILDQTGSPTLAPQGRDIHLDLTDAQLNGSLSFIHTTRHSRFNQKRQGLDSEQVLIGRGSVLVYDLKSPMPLALYSQLMSQGIGINKQQGLGWVYPDPQWATGMRLHHEALFAPISIGELRAKPVAAPLAAATTPLTEWVQARTCAQAVGIADQQRVNEMLYTIKCHYDRARTFNRCLASVATGPSITQWRQISNIVRQGGADWAHKVFKGTSPVCTAKNDDQGWGIRWFEGQQLISFAEATEALLKDCDLGFMRLLLEQLCRYDLSSYQGLQTYNKLNPTSGSE